MTRRLWHPPRGRGGSVLTQYHKDLAGKIWEIANRLRGPYRPPQYRLVMLPMVVLRRLDCVLEPTKEAVLTEHKRSSLPNATERGPAPPHDVRFASAGPDFQNG